MHKRIYRSNVDNKIAGVCGGLGEYFNIDPTIVRIIMFLLVFANGAGLIIYIVGWIVMPKRPVVGSTDGNNVASASNASAGEVEEKKEDTPNASYLWPGLILIAIGLIFLAHNVWWWFDWDDFWPVILIVAGGLILFRTLNNDKESSEKSQSKTGGIANESS